MMARPTILLCALIALLAVQGTPAFFSLADTAATTKPEQASLKVGRPYTQGKDTVHRMAHDASGSGA